MPIRITHCVCYGKSFAELKAIAEREQATSIEQLQKHVDFGLNCKLCQAYVRRMLRTGETEFCEIVADLTEPAPK